MDFELLRAFVNVVEMGSMGDAAPSLNCTAPAVSQKMARLEKQIGVPLLDRLPHGVEPTPAGELLLQRARQLIGMATDIETEVRATSIETSRRLRLASFSSMNVNVLPKVLGRPQRAFPDAALSLTEMDYHDPCADVLSGRVDMAIAFRYDHVPIDIPDGVEVELLGHEPLIAALPKQHDLSKRRSINLVDLRDEPWVFFPEGNVARSSVEAETIRHDFLPNVLFQTRDYQVIHVLVGTGLGVALLPSMMAPEFNSRNVSVRPLRNTKLGREIMLIARPGYESEVASRFRDLIKEAIYEMGWLT